MKKLLLIIMPISIIIALFSFQFNKNYTWLTFLQGLSDTEFYNIDWDKVKQLFEILNFEEITANLTQYWNNVSELFTFLYAIGMTIVSIGQYIIEVFKVIWVILQILALIFGWLFINLYSLIKFVTTYIFIS